MRLVYLSPVPWGSFAQRPHKFVEWFHGRSDGPVFWVDPYPTRLPAWQDLCRSRLDFVSDKILPSWLEIISPAALPIEPLPGSILLNKYLWRKLIDRVVEFSARQPTLFVVGKPSALALHLLSRLSYCPSVFDAMDDFPAFYSGVSRFAMAWRERQLVNAVDRVFVSSQRLLERLGNINKTTELVRNACDTERLPSIGSKTMDKGKYVIGYVGTIASWFDWPLVLRLAEARPEVHIRLVGPLHAKPPKALPDNIELLPGCDHVRAIQHLETFTVGLIPFMRTPLTESVDPIKYYEYRAMGLPVLTTNFGEMRFRQSEAGVFFIDDKSDLLMVTRRAFEHRDSCDWQRRFRLDNSWKTRFDTAGLL